MEQYSIDARKAVFINKDTIIKSDSRLQFIVKDEDNDSDLFTYNISDLMVGVAVSVKDNILEDAILFQNVDNSGILVKPNNETVVRGLISKLRYINKEIIFYKDKAFLVQVYKCDVLKDNKKMFLLWTWEE